MTNLKINSSATPYWCVVVPVDSCEFFVNKVGCIRYTHNKGRESSCIEPMQLGWYATEENTAILGCITSSGMDEGVRELVRKADVVELYMDYMNNVFDTFRFRKPHESALSLLTHNQITLTTDQKAVVVKQK
jgi:hypothetical protein